MKRKMTTSSAMRSARRNKKMDGGKKLRRSIGEALAKKGKKKDAEGK
jgi:hypothetical protein